MSELIYPSTVVNLRLRFDETFQVTSIPEPGPQGGDPTVAAVVPAASTSGQSPKVSLATKPGKLSPNLRPLITQTGKDNLSFVQNRIPKSATVECPNYRTAGKFSLEFDWRELPIDPRLVRSAAVDIYMGSVPADEFSRGMIGIDPNGRRASVLDTGGLFSASQVRDDLMVLTGIVDNWFVQHNDTGSIVKVDGRDLRGLFLDSPVDPEVMNKLNLNQSVVDVVSDIILHHPASAYMKVRYNPGDWPGGTPSKLLDKDGLTRVRRSADGENAAGGTTDSDLNMWDLITRYCDLVGAVPYFRGHNLLIRPAQSLHDPSKPRLDSTTKVFDPQPRVDDDGNPFFERKMVFGRNIKELTFERKLSGTKVPVVELVSFDTSSTERGAKKLLTVQYPPKDEKLARISGVLPSGEVAQTDKLKISVPGVRDIEKLFALAKQLYEEIGRGELGGSCSTSMISSFKGDNDDPDLLRLRPGDQVEFLVDVRRLNSQAPNVSTFTNSERRPFDEEVKFIKESLSGKAGTGDENLARVIVASSRSQIIQLLRTFRVANVVFNWSLTSGTQISFDFQNYFVPRSQVTDQLGENTDASVSKTIVSTKSKRPKVQTPAAPVLKAPPQVAIMTSRPVSSTPVTRGRR